MVLADVSVDDEADKELGAEPAELLAVLEEGDWPALLELLGTLEEGDWVVPLELAAWITDVVEGT